MFLHGGHSDITKAFLKDSNYCKNNLVADLHKCDEEGISRPWEVLQTPDSCVLSTPSISKISAHCYKALFDDENPIFSKKVILCWALTIKNHSLIKDLLAKFDRDNEEDLDILRTLFDECSFFELDESVENGFLDRMFEFYLDQPIVKLALDSKCKLCREKIPKCLDPMVKNRLKIVVNRRLSRENQ